MNSESLQDTNEVKKKIKFTIVSKRKNIWEQILFKCKTNTEKYKTLL